MGGNTLPPKNDLGEKWVFLVEGVVLCLVGADTGVRPEGDERDLYRLSIDDSIDFQLYVLVSKSGHVCEDP